MSTPLPPAPQAPTAAPAPSPLHQNLPAASGSVGNLPVAIVAGAIAAFVGGVLWAVVTVSTGYQIGFMAVGVGFLVGSAVGKFGAGQSMAFRLSGAVLALLGCVLGNFFTLVGFAGQEGNASFFTVLGSIDYAAIPGIMASAASPMDFLFYAIAVYEGFKLSVKG